MTVSEFRRKVRRGSVIPMLAVCVVALFGFVALAIDMGMLMVARTECQNAADAAALAGARTLDNDVPPGVDPRNYDNSKYEAAENARLAVTSNIFLNSNFSQDRIEALRIGVYDYDYDTQQFIAKFGTAGEQAKAEGKAWSAVEVVVNGTQPSYFARVLGISAMPTTARAVAVHRPRDIAMVLDFTGSMGFATTVTYERPGTGSQATQNNYRRIYNSNDTAWPQFGHYSRYLAYAVANPTGNQKNGTVANRPNPLYQTGTVLAAPYVYSPANVTVTTPNGPPIVRNFLYDPQATGPNVTTDLLTSAFHAESFSLTRSWSGATLTAGPTPAPDNYVDQSDSPVPFAGDKWPRKWGFVAPPTGANWAANTTNGAAITAAEYLGWSPRYTSGSSVPNINYGSFPGRNEFNFRDATWERYGYDLDVAHYVANRGSNWDPRWDWDLNSNSWQHHRTTNPSDSFRPRLKPPAERFQGYTMGPGYWGKTFFIWPPDPRPQHDWRLKFFRRANNTEFQTQGSTSDVDADTVTTGNQTINGALLTPSAGSTLRAIGSTYTVNYEAILAWIKSPPHVFPPNLRAGRVRYYTSIPNDVNFNTGTADERMDKRFWRAYIDYVLAADPTAGRQLAGVETQGWPEGVNPNILVNGEMTGFDSDGSGPLPADPRPYMRYIDNPSRPRMHMWFGPITMIAFLDSRGMFAGTTHEAQCWQLKVGVNSSLDDIRANHPNDLVGMAFFTKFPNNPSRSYREIMVPIGQDWLNLKNSLFFPRSLLPAIENGNITAEVRPYDNNVNYTGWTNIPNAQANTDPNTGLMLAFNILAPSPFVNADPARRGRIGAAKIVIFETDGIPNAAQNGTFVRRGYESFYSNISGNHPSFPDNQTGGSNAAYAVVDQIRKPMATTNATNVDSGMSMPNAPARVYSIGFGDIFETSLGPTAANFLLEIQKRGGTSRPTDTAIPDYQIITGPFDTRITNLRTALERILQSGVQVTLIE